MNEDKFNMDIRKFLKRVGVTAQREIEHAVYEGVQKGSLQGNEKFSVRVTLEVPALGIAHPIDGEIALE